MAIRNVRESRPDRNFDKERAVRTIAAILLSVSVAASDPALAHHSGSASPAAKTAMKISSHLDLNSFPNSTEPSRQRFAHPPANYGFTKVERVPDGWAQISRRDDSWHLGALLLEGNEKRAVRYFTDSVGNAGTYRSTQVLGLRLNGPAVRTADRSDCKGVSTDRTSQADVVAPTPAAILRHLDGFRESLSENDPHHLDRTLPRSPDGGIAQCDGGQGSGASREVGAYVAALHRVGLMRRL